MNEYIVDRESLKLFTRWSDHLRFRDRFHLPKPDEDLVNQIVDYSIERRLITLKTDQLFYRARIHKSDDQDMLPMSEMGAPPRDKAKGGRLNPVGIPYLYLSNDVDTSIAEGRPWLDAIVTVASFRARNNINIVNLNYRDAKSEDFQVDKGPPGEYKAFLMFMSQTLAKPQDPNNETMYIPTQYLAEKFKLQGVGGMMYQSVLKKPGSNLVLFDPKLVEEENRFLYHVKGVSYDAKLEKKA